MRVELLAETQSIRPGETFWVALRQQITPGWHTYWGVNPGDTGESTRIEWTLPDGFVAGEISWPAPSRFLVKIAMSYGYEGEVVLPVPVRAPGDAVPGTTVTMRGLASWLVCEETCIPEEAPLARRLRVDAGGGQPHRDRIHGPTRLIECASAQDRASRTHSVWRDPARDSGADLLGAHRERGHRHDHG